MSIFFEFIKHQKSMLSLTGIWPQRSYSIPYRFSQICSVLSIFSLCMIMGITVFYSKDVATFSESLFLSVSIFTTLLKLFNFFANRRNLMELLEYLLDEDFNVYPERCNEFIQVKLRRYNILRVWYTTVCAGCVIFYAFIPAIDKSSPLPIPFPFFHTGPLRYPTYFTEIWSLGQSAWNNGNIDLLTVALMTVVAAQLDILKVKLEDADKEKETLRNSQLNNNLTDDEVMEIYFKKCVIHHVKLIRLVKDTDDVFTAGLLVQFAASIIVMCNSAFQLLIVPIWSMKFPTVVVYFLTMATQLAMYCYFGNEVIIKSTEIGKACYMSKWYNYGPRVNKTLFMIIERSKRPLKITTWKFSTLSLPAFSNIMQWSYSYFTVLRRLYNQKQE